MTMSPLLSLCNLTDIRSTNNISLAYNVGSIDGPAHCNAWKLEQIVFQNQTGAKYTYITEWCSFIYK